MLQNVNRKFCVEIITKQFVIFHREEKYFCDEAKNRAKTDHQVVLVWKNTWFNWCLISFERINASKKRLKLVYFISAL